MKLVPREIEKLMLHNAGHLAQKRLARGKRLNYTESVALIATQVTYQYFLYIYIFPRFLGRIFISVLIGWVSKII